MTEQHTPRYPQVEIRLTGEDGNAFEIVARVRALLEEFVSEEAGEAYFSEALSGSHSKMLRVTGEWVTVL